MRKAVILIVRVTSAYILNSYFHCIMSFIVYMTSWVPLEILCWVYDNVQTRCFRGNSCLPSSPDIKESNPTCTLLITVENFWWYPQVLKAGQYIKVWQTSMFTDRWWRSHAGYASLPIKETQVDLEHNKDSWKVLGEKRSAEIFCYICLVMYWSIQKAQPTINISF